MIDWITNHYNALIVIILMMVGLWAMIATKNLIKKCIGMAIFQTGIILFYISLGAKTGSTIPIMDHHAAHGAKHAIHAIDYANPLTQILMLTAIVVGVGTLGVALSLIQRLYDTYQSTNEDDILESIKND